MPRVPALLAVLLATFPVVLVAAGEPRVIPLWPEGVPGRKVEALPPEEFKENRFYHVHDPALIVYPPRDVPANGAAVVLIPGGGYLRIAVGEQGGAQTRWLNSLGVTVFLLKYRLADYGAPAPFQDVIRAMRTVRRDAATFGVDPRRIGVWGASAGGHLAACAATMWDDPLGKTGAAIDAVSARPDFALLVYPVVTMDAAFAHGGSRRALLGANPTAAAVAQWSIERRVRPEMPPVWIAATMADQSVPVANSLRLYDALVSAKVPAELHVYAQGSHGNSLDPHYGPTADWPKRAEEWLRFNGWLHVASTPTSPTLPGNAVPSPAAKH
jgi:acetyl esterase/lipase